MFRCKASCTPSIGQCDRNSFVNLLRGMLPRRVCLFVCSTEFSLRRVSMDRRVDPFNRSLCRLVLLLSCLLHGMLLRRVLSPLSGFDRLMRSVFFFQLAPRKVVVESYGNSRCSRCNALAIALLRSRPMRSELDAC